MNKTIITSALPYVNNVPHLGNLIGSILSADVYARYLRNYHDPNKIIFIGGVDEYGTATEIKAREMNITCKELCDKNGSLHKEIYDWFMISFDCYGNTSQPNGDPSIVMNDWPQTKITHEIFRKLCDNNYIIEQTEDVMYCEALDTFVADRFVTGTCKYCKSEKADGDQCDACGKLLSPNDIINPRYKPNPNLSLEIRQTTNLYIDTNRIWQDYKMNDWYDSVSNSVSNSWSKNAIEITNEWLKAGLKPRSISRDLKWGTRIPETPQFGTKYDSKVFYVWFDAPIGYISISENSLGVEKSESFWKENVKLIQFMAKDNVPFHSVIFPVTLFGSGYAKPNVNIASTEYLLYEGGKFSKSKNTGLFCDDVMKISKKLNIPPDYWRAYLISIRPESGDSNFVLNGDTGFVGFVNNILIKNFGNLIFRILSIAYQIKLKHNIAELPNHITHRSEQMDKLDKDCENIMSEYHENMDKYSLMGGLKATMKYSSRLNQNISDVAPWTYLKNNDDTVKLYEYINAMYAYVDRLLKMMNPFMPSVCDKIRNNDFHYFGNTIILPNTKPNIPISALSDIVIS